MVNVEIKKCEGFSKKKPFAVVRMSRNDNPLLGAMFGFSNSYVAVFDLSRTVQQKEWEQDDADINGFFRKFKELVNENLNEFKFYDFTIEELSDNACKSVLIVSTKQVMSTRRILSLTGRESSFLVAKQTFNASVLKGRYKMLTEDEASKLFEKRSKSANKDEDEED